MFQNPRISPHRKTFQLIRECVHETNYLGKERFANTLKQQEGKIPKIRHFLFLHPTSILLIVFLITTIVFLGSSLIVRNFVNILWIRLLFILSFSFIYITIPVFVQIITPKFDMKWEERWGQVFNSYLHKIELTSAQAELSLSEQQKLRFKKAELSLKKAILYYSRTGKPISLFIKLLFGGIFIGCLPDPEFQKALISMSLSVIWDTNLFGAISILILPCVYIPYFAIYDVPITLMEQIVTQIELVGVDF
ncbi:hypothetical protein H6G17_17040 [Chroococcidiopsis sp. FACHB-1243]|uniref:hypothetical protein n=1 Tax=Chroococcidiopsis sp. [FACHB-1243] TaxID=2692781 RepID=UPI0019CB2D93|nr:hypothetical protein [Chroococcidiopsis sp. [FACHB-1243]]MBD2307204.1 hypothetical protein [Chroococcidiopsis sp. [FACHB-1243]]